MKQREFWHRRGTFVQLSNNSSTAATILAMASPGAHVPCPIAQSVRHLALCTGGYRLLVVALVPLAFVLVCRLSHFCHWFTGSGKPWLCLFMQSYSVLLLSGVVTYATRVMAKESGCKFAFVVHYTGLGPVRCNSNPTPKLVSKKRTNEEASVECLYCATLGCRGRLFPWDPWPKRCLSCILFSYSRGVQAIRQRRSGE